MLMSDRERALFDEEQEAFEAAYKEVLEAAQDRFRKDYDILLPIWLRGSYPERALDELRDRANRLQCVVQGYHAGTETREHLIERILDEGPDIINYTAYMMAHAVVLHKFSSKEPTKVLGS